MAGQARRDPRASRDLPVWVSEVGVSTFGAEEVQEWGLRRTAELLIGRAPRIHWYSLYDLPRRLARDDAPPGGRGLVLLPALPHGPAATRTARPKRAARAFRRTSRPEFGLCQWFHFEDHRLDDAVRWMKDLGVTYLRTGLSWADWFRPTRSAWFDRQMRALEPFDVTVTFCFTPEHRGYLGRTTPARRSSPRSSPSSAPR